MSLGPFPFPQVSKLVVEAVAVWAKSLHFWCQVSWPSTRNVLPQCSRMHSTSPSNRCKTFFPCMRSPLCSSGHFASQFVVTKSPTLYCSLERAASYHFVWVLYVLYSVWVNTQCCFYCSIVSVQRDRVHRVHLGAIGPDLRAFSIAPLSPLITLLCAHVWLSQGFAKCICIDLNCCVFAGLPV